MTQNNDELDNNELLTSLKETLENCSLAAFGQNQYIAYGKGKYKVQEGIMGREVANPLGDTLVKDMTMVVLQPVSIALAGAITSAVGLVSAALLVVPALVSEKSRTGFAISLGVAMVGAGISILAAVAPLARLYNLSTRAYATVSDSKSDKLEKEENYSEMSTSIRALAPELMAGKKEALKSCLKVARDATEDCNSAPTPTNTESKVTQAKIKKRVQFNLDDGIEPKEPRMGG